jgi:subtilase family serine protease
LSACTTANKCLEKHQMATKMKQSSGWALETALDTEWAHAIAPDAKILVVEATSASGPDLLKAVDYARKRSDVTAISMSWGGKEFKDETKADTHFTSDHDIAFFSASGDNGFGVSWPASSPNVIGVGGTSLSFNQDGSYDTEKAWSGSGGGVSTFETEPGFQKSYSIAKAGGKRATPDVSFHADPKLGYSVYHQISAATAKSAKKGWYVVGGTSAGAPQWAAIKALDTANATSTVNYITQLYQDKASNNHSALFRDITSGSNGDCGYYCDARGHYDYVTGLGSPIAHKF